jgi:hypothetical protein
MQPPSNYVSVSFKDDCQVRPGDFGIQLPEEAEVDAVEALPVSLA